MFDGFRSGVFGGLFGPTISRWLARWFGRYKCWKIFAATMFCVYGIEFFAAWLKFGFRDSLTLLRAMLILPGVLVQWIGLRFYNTRIFRLNIDGK